MSDRRSVRSAALCAAALMLCLAAAARGSEPTSSTLRPGYGTLALDPATTLPVFTIDELIAYAMVNSPDLQQREIRRASQALQTLIERSAFAFNLETESRLDIDSETENNRQSHGATLSKRIPGGIDVSLGAELADTFQTHTPLGSYSIEISKIILKGGTLSESYAPIDQSLIEETIRQNEVRRERRNIVFRVKRLYYQVIRNRQTLRIQELRLERARRNLELTIARENPLDIEIARLEVPRTRTAVISARRQIDSTLDELKVFIGLAAQEPFTVSDTFDFEMRPIAVDQAITFARENQEDILNSRLRREAFEIDHLVARRRLWPELRVFGSHREESLDRIDFAGRDSQSVGVGLRWEIGRRGDRARYERARNQLRDQDFEIWQVEQEQIRSLRDLAKRLEEVAESVRLQEERVRVNERIVELFQDRYDNGQIDILELIRSQNDLEDARVTLVNFKTSYMDLLAEYRFTEGRF